MHVDTSKTHMTREALNGEVWFRVLTMTGAISRTSCSLGSVVRVEHCSFSSLLTFTPPLTLGVTVLRYGSTETRFGFQTNLACNTVQLEQRKDRYKHDA